MMNAQLPQETCIIVGASHGGVNLAFALRKEGYTGRILLIDTCLLYTSDAADE